MQRIDLRRLSFPKNVHMDLLAQVLTERQIVKLLNFFSEMKPSERIVRFPKRQTILKAVGYFYGELVMAGKMTWEQASHQNFKRR